MNVDRPGRSLEEQRLELLTTETLRRTKQGFHGLDHHGVPGEHAGDVAGARHVEYVWDVEEGEGRTVQPHLGEEGGQQAVQLQPAGQVGGRPAGATANKLWGC